MKVYYDSKSLQSDIERIRKNKSVGFIPTMGALHKGHLSLIERAVKENGFTVVSIFVNPTQFDKEEDLEKYPRTLKKDLELLKTSGCDAVFAPSPKDIYNGKVHALNFDFDGLEFEMEGKHRKGHFNGVGTVVKKMFEIVQPDKAYFGEKDFQQLLIIKKLVKKAKIQVKIVGCDIYRAADGLALSSRNSRLNELQRKEAPYIYKTLQKAKQLFKDKSIAELLGWVKKEFRKNPVLELEYFEIANAQTLKAAKRKSKKSNYRGFIAVYAGKVRLIDNLELN